MVTAKKHVTKTDLMNSTLETQHIKHLEAVLPCEDALNKLRAKAERLRRKLAHLQALDGASYTPDTLREMSSARETLAATEAEIARMESGNDMMDYLDSTLDILVDYYKKGRKDEAAPPVISDVRHITDLFKRSNASQKNEKYKLYEKYINVIYNHDTKKASSVVSCTNCSVEKVYSPTDGMMVCTKCGDTDIVFIDPDKGAYKEHAFESKASAYKRINHMSELLNQFQAKESTDISEDVLNQIKDEIRKQRITDVKTLNQKKMRSILKKLKLNKYYEHVNHILNKLGVRPPIMSREVEERLKQMFKDIQEPFVLYRPKNRKNFLSYYYIIHKLCELLELDEFLPCFPLLRSREKLLEQDAIWAKICAHLGYEFIPSA